MWQKGKYLNNYPKKNMLVVVFPDEFAVSWWVCYFLMSLLFSCLLVFDNIWKKVQSGRQGLMKMCVMASYEGRCVHQFILLGIKTLRWTKHSARLLISKMVYQDYNNEIWEFKNKFEFTNTCNTTTIGINSTPTQ